MTITEHRHGNYRLISHGGLAWTIAEGEFPWLMGLYDSDLTAIAAAEWFSDRELEFLAARVCMNQGRTITSPDLDDYLKEVNKCLR